MVSGLLENRNTTVNKMSSYGGIYKGKTILNKNGQWYMLWPGTW